jgi:transcriptional regulator with XRE-family HTH domain
MNNRKTNIPNNLKEYRLKAGLRQIDVAKLLGFTTEERICHWEKGRNIPNIINLFKLAKIYKVRAEELYNKISTES